MAGKDQKSDPDQLSTIPHERQGDRPDYSKPLPRQKLPKELQDTLDHEDRFWDVLTSGNAGETTDSSVRYAAYASRLRTIMLSAHRYVAYTSDIGESFRPVAHPWLVRGAYGVSWAYLAGDVSHEGYKAYKHNQRILHPETDEDKAAVATRPGGQRIPAIEDYRAVMVQRAVFQSIASMGLPAFTIHSIVRYSGRAMKNVKNVRLRTWGPIGLGLAAVPALPFMFDKPVEEATEWVFHKAFEAIGGPTAVGKDKHGQGPEVGHKQSEKSSVKDEI
ncbi:Mitochondrial fission process protein 1 [Pseudocercospora fuligena]|uniref:Mitochondrial fission process protein 1 n=1 Tax=Pseudocercospora fuligena TaxID=685502 RepID=A0A8H6RSP6_9PEZI|nr:Mitochondrial fission process protein 1 [Pseudocercospora fuligena]KAF7196779.1 Mitochondrial fission process protein 1 [Pseudocercospora fuligena]